MTDHDFVCMNSLTDSSHAAIARWLGSGLLTVIYLFRPQR